MSGGGFGEVPAALGELTNLTRFSVQGNDLTGCLPLGLIRFDRGVLDNPRLRFCFAVDDDPTAVIAASWLTIGEGGALTIDESVLLANDPETANSTLRITNVGDAVNGTVSVVGPTITYVHDGSETTTGSLTYTASDAVYADTAIVTVAVIPVNDPPVAVGETAVTQEGGTLSFTASALLTNDSDAENDRLRVSAVGGAVNGVPYR